MSSKDERPARAGSLVRTVVGAATAGLVILVGLGLTVALLVASFGLPNPFGTTTTEADDAVALAAVSDLSRFEAAQGRFSTVVDRDEDADYLPDFVKGERVVMVAEADVVATVELSGLTRSGIEVSDDGDTVTVHVPHPQLQAPRLDPDTTRVVTRERGLLDRLDDALTSGEPSPDQPLLQRASEKVTEAAEQSDLEERARENTERFLVDALTEAGFDDVVVVWGQPPAGPAAGDA